MQLSLVGSARGVFDAGGKTLTFAPPVDALEGDVLVVVIAHDAAEAFTVPDGWTQIAAAAGTEALAAIATAYDGDGASTVIVLGAAAHEWQGLIVAYRGGAAHLVLDASAAANFAATVDLAPASVTCIQATDQLLVVWSAAGAPALTPPAALAELDTFSTAVVAARTLLVAGAVANATDVVAPGHATASVVATGSALTLALRANVPAVPLELYDPVPGNIGLLGKDLRASAASPVPSSVAIIRFTEPAGVHPADALRNLGDLGPDVGTTMPASVRTWTGDGRQFTQAGTTGLIGEDTSANGTLLQRDAYVRAILALDRAGAAGAQCVVCRGINDGTPDEQVSLALELQEQAWNPGFVEVRLCWRDGAGALVNAPPGVFQAPADGAFFLLTATRRWASSNQVVVRYYVDEQQIAELVTTAGDVAGSTVAKTTVGARKSAGAWDHFFQGVLDELELGNYEMSAEEVRQDWHRLYIHQPAGVAMFAGLCPPGSPWAKNPGNKIWKRVKIVGQMHGLAFATVEKLRALGLPDAGTIEISQRWEAMCKLVPAVRDSLDVRRARIAAHEARAGGFALPSLETAIAPVLGTTAANVEIVEFTNLLADDFSGAAIARERWFAGPVGAWSLAGGTLALAVANGTDLSWASTRAWCHLRAPLPATDGVLCYQAKLATYWAALPANTIVGAFLYNRRSQNSIWFGVGDVAGVRHVGYRIFAAGVLGAFVPLAASPDAALWLRVTRLASDAAGSYTFGWSTTGPFAGYVFAQVATGVTDVEYAGFAAMSAGPIGSALATTFDDFLCRSPNGLRPFAWYAYRDPALPGVVDRLGARALLARLKPAHTYAAAITSKSVLCDDPIDGLCDGGPLGAL